MILSRRDILLSGTGLAAGTLATSLRGGPAFAEAGHLQELRS